MFGLSYYYVVNYTDLLNIGLDNSFVWAMLDSQSAGHRQSVTLMDSEGSPPWGYHRSVHCEAADPLQKTAPRREQFHVTFENVTSMDSLMVDPLIELITTHG